LNPSSSALSFQNVSKIYRDAAGGERYALRNVSFEIPLGKRIAMIGRSGSGKSTLLHLAAGIDVPSQGEVLLAGQSLGKLSDHERTLLRREGVGLIFQFFHLLPHLSVHDNIALPNMIRGANRAQTEQRVRFLLERVGLADRAKDPVQKLSGGEMQRVAICRALLPKPRLLLADEPTGNLDDATSEQVLNLLMELTAEEKTSLLLVTHSREMAARADEIWEIHNGEIHWPRHAGGL